MKNARAIFRFLADCAAHGEAAVLVTLTHAQGSTARAPGTHMAVAASGAWIGSFSGGCVEAAVIAEAHNVLASGAARSVRFGAGSPYLDIRLPCGGGIDLHFLPRPDPAALASASALLERRRPLLLALEGGALAVREADAREATGWQGGTFQVRHDPDLRLVILGHGAEPAALLRLSTAYGADALLLTPDTALAEWAQAEGHEAHILRTLGQSDALSVDPWSAVVTLFHDHDWETALLAQALEQDPFFIGAMGSRATHEERCRRLIETGITPERTGAVTGPIGLIPSSRDPDTLALSVLAQVVREYEALRPAQPRDERRA